MAVGKSTIASSLISAHAFTPLSSSAYLKALAVKESLEVIRSNLQELGDRLDRDTDFLWVVTEVAKKTIDSNPAVVNWLFDSVRKPRQVEHFKHHFPNQILHIHLTAPEEILKVRYQERYLANTSGIDSIPYEKAITHPNEVSSRSLIEIADLVFNTSVNTSHQISAEILSALNKE